jgi:hypothetical protein
VGVGRPDVRPVDTTEIEQLDSWVAPTVNQAIGISAPGHNASRPERKHPAGQARLAQGAPEGLYAIPSARQ